MDKSKQNGLANTKPKWTRISRMDSGLRGSSEEESKNRLGKKGPPQITEEDLNENLVKQQMKRIKTQDNEITHAAAGVMAHPCQSQ